MFEFYCNTLQADQLLYILLVKAVTELMGGDINRNTYESYCSVPVLLDMVEVDAKMSMMGELKDDL